LQRDEQHGGGEQAAGRDDHGRAEPVQRVLDQQVGAAPDGGQRGEQGGMASGHGFESRNASALAPMTIRSAPYQGDLSELELDELVLVVSDFFSDALESLLSAPEAAESWFSRRRLAVP